MGSTVLFMSMSLDGFVAGPSGDPDDPRYDDVERLHAWFLRGEDDAGARAFDPGEGVNGRIFAELLATGAVIAGAPTFEQAHGWSGDHHDGVQVLIVSRHEPRIDIGGWPLVEYVPDVTTATARARAAAGDRDVLLHGAVLAGLALDAGVLDEIEIHLVPVVLGRGRRLFEGVDGAPARLERTRVLEGEHGMTHLHYRVLRTG